MPRNRLEAYLTQCGEVGTVRADRPATAIAPCIAEVLMDKIENFIFSVALIGAGLITLVTLPLA
ncbi:hypothetical protein [Sphingosinicella sp. YJ22]|uniref:hypothetical protein n=1 Tax=Sphingosinicella sp. YJ22 TaxID=1104780 RepID=UPI00140989DC|nr:hypothetical protein [Sphingosinicella sp. YJ22]